MGTVWPQEAIDLYGGTPNIQIRNWSETEAGIVLRDQDLQTTQFGKLLWNSGGDNEFDFYINDNSIPKMTIKSNGNILRGKNLNPLRDVRLWVETASNTLGKVGVLSNSNYSTPWGYGFLAAFPSSQFKPYAAIDVSTNKEVFAVHGNGYVFAQDLTVK